MQTHFKNSGALKLSWCRYGLSRLQFRGPRRSLETGYIACLGGAETLARYVPDPYPTLLEEELGLPCINLGLPKAGPDAFLGDSALRAILHDAWAVTIELPSVTNLSNRFYKVHPRRNDRFIAPTEALLTLYPDVDFTDVAFTGHLVHKLRRKDAGRFETVAQVLRQTWLRRMTHLIAEMDGPIQILDFGPDFRPELVEDEMLAKVVGMTDGICQIKTGRGDTTGMAFGPLERHLAEGAVGLHGHRKAAAQLADALAVY